MNYDQTDPQSIEKYAQELVGKSLRQAIGTGIVILRKPGGKGNLGQLVEEQYFDIHPGNSPEPDFKEAGVELKTFPLKKQKKTLVAKERISLGMIDYHGVVNENWGKSSLLKKNSLPLLMAYLFEAEKPSPIDFIFKFAKLWKFPAEDLKIIADDWTKIVSKIKQGRAHELSEGETMYLGAVTKAADSSVRRSQPFGPAAKPRAFSLKQNYVNVIIRQILGGAGVAELEKAVKDTHQYLKGETFESLVTKKFDAYIGMSIDDIHSKLGVKLNPRAKNFASDVTRAILGVKKRRIEEFEKAGVTVKTIRLRQNGTPKEDMSFPAFKMRELVQEKWEESTLKDSLEKRFFLVVFQFDDRKRLVLNRVMFWTIPTALLDGEVQHVWKETIKRISVGSPGNLPKSSESTVCHVRPHARNGKDVDVAPNGMKVVKQSFWLNNDFIGKQIS